MRRFLQLFLAVALAASPFAARAQQADTAALVASQVEAMRTFAMLDGVWRGPATVRQADGSSLDFVQTERMGPFLGATSPPSATPNCTRSAI